MKKVIYTCITNDYDTIKEPKVITKGWDYICFYDKKKPDIKTIWKFIQVPKGQKVERKTKIYNEYIFSNYDLSIWVDGSMTINTNLDEFIKDCSDFTLMFHPSRNCIYEEATACVYLNKDSKEVIQRQIEKYLKEGYPVQYGMVATGVMFRKHTKEIKEFCRLWWNEVLNYSRRDQLSFNYIVWKTGLLYGLVPFEILRNKFILNRHK